MKSPFIRFSLADAGHGHIHLNVHEIAAVWSDLEISGKPRGVVYTKQGQRSLVSETAPQVMALIEAKFQELFS